VLPIRLMSNQNWRDARDHCQTGWSNFCSLNTASLLLCVLSAV
jgi:hypothetical protein